MLQPIPSPYRRTRRVLAVLFVASLIALVAFRQEGAAWPAGKIAGLLGVGLSAILGVGIGLYARTLAQQLAAMRSGSLVASWHGPDRVPIDVGPNLALVGGAVRPWNSRLQTVRSVELRPADDVAGRVVVHGIFDNGNGPNAFSVELPFTAGDAEVAEACARALAAHHGVSLEAVAGPAVG
jgi:hypothetical protein